MATNKKSTKTDGGSKKRAPALTPEARENQLISLAYDLVEQRLLDGTASAQETTHFLKLGSTKERIEKQMMEKQMQLVEAKVENLQSMKRIEELYSEALHAMREYSGQTNFDDVVVEDD